jgi:hypothetical protein
MDAKHYYRFAGTNGWYAATDDKEGKRLPPEHRPWKRADPAAWWIIKDDPYQRDSLVQEPEILAAIEAKGIFLIHEDELRRRFESKRPSEAGPC